jgi:hypothetical protein
MICCIALREAWQNTAESSNNAVILYQNRSEAMDATPPEGDATTPDPVEPKLYRIASLHELWPRTDLSNDKTS